MSEGVAPWGRPQIITPALMVVAVFLAFFWHLGAVPLYDLDEGAFSEATREMLASGNYITPYRDGEPRYDKPVLIYWLQALSVQLGGLNERSLRLPSAMAATLWAWALYRFARPRLDPTGAAVALLLMVNSLQVGIIAKAATADALLNLWLALTLFDIYRYAEHPEPSLRRRAYLWMGLGFLTKGPVAVLFPFLISLAYFLSLGRFRDWRGALFDPIGWLVLTLVVVPWHLAIFLDNGTGFFESFFLHHNLGRFRDTIHGHEGFPFYYLVVVPLILLPFSGWLLALLPRVLQGLQDPLDRFLWLWFAVVVLFFSFSGTQLPHYALHGATPLFLLMARHRTCLLNRWLAFLPPLLFLGILLGLPDVLDLARGYLSRPEQLALLAEGRGLLGWDYRLAIGTGLLALGALGLWRGIPVWQGLVLAGFLQTLLVSGVVIPRVLETLQGPVKEAAGIARASGLPTLAYRTNMPSFSVYREGITPAGKPPRGGEMVFLSIDKLERFAQDYPHLTSEVIYRRGAVALLRIQGGHDQG